MECYKGFCDLNHQGSDGHVQAQSPTTGGHIWVKFPFQVA